MAVSLLAPLSLDNSGRAVLCLHQTTRNPKYGRREPTGKLGDESMHYALELASRGFVTLSIDYPGFGDTEQFRANPDIADGEDFRSVTLMGVWRHMRAIDILERIPASILKFELKRLGVIGHSLGGSNALFLACFDDRVDAVVCSAGMTTFKAYAQNSQWAEKEPYKHWGWHGTVKGWSRNDKYMPLVDSEKFEAQPEKMPFDFDQLLMAVAPKPLFVNAPQKDEEFPFREMYWVADEGQDAAMAQWVKREGTGIELIHRRVSAYYAWMAARLGIEVSKSGAGTTGAESSRFEIVTPDCGHDFRPDERMAAYHFLDMYL
jgi:pimeloyl-ACP methyl ester carboxylesterase